MNIRHTDKLYLDDPYETNFRATVISASPRGIVLDRSCFYPESGGQMCDRGKLGDFDVVDVQEGDGESIVHIVRGDATAQGELDGHVDWERRFDHMQQHTGQHVLSRAFIDTAGLATVSFHMGEDTCTI
ncbi:MAG: alanyl-tRNA editing protein, partial [Candidatus Krumholzibacteriota bacterium]|nr:alanyl-tRNA editing protein [Candidatus Krumholzibacteriota bacterium]